MPQYGVLKALLGLVGSIADTFILRRPKITISSNRSWGVLGPQIHAEDLTAFVFVQPWSQMEFGSLIKV